MSFNLGGQGKGSAGHNRDLGYGGGGHIIHPVPDFCPFQNNIPSQS